MPPVDSTDVATPETDDGPGPRPELEVPPEITPEMPEFPDFPEDPPEQDLDDYVADDDDDRLPDADLGDDEGADPDFDPCSVLEQVTGY